MDDLAAARGGPVIAIDGPAGAGKSTLARELARSLQLQYVNTGLMYRMLAARALAKGIDPDDERSLAREAETIAFNLEPSHRPVGEDSRDGRREPPSELWIDGSPPPPALTSSEVEAVVSRVARHPAVREILRREQRRLGVGGSVIEGRDIGTVVFPDADLKLFLSAAPKVRAGRREQERTGGGAGTAIARRDELDARTNRFVPAPDAYSLDTTTLDADDVLRAALALVQRVLGLDGSPASSAERS